MATAKKDAAKPLRKITVRDVYGKIEGETFDKVRALKGKPLALMDVVGIAGRAKPGTSDYGPFIKFQGQFQATNLATGEVFRSAALLLPKFLEDDLIGAMSIKGSDDVKQAEFAIRLSAIADDKSATKYVYVADSLIEPQESAPLAALIEKASQAAKALPAPKA